VHFYDMLIWVFGPVEASTLHLKQTECAGGTLQELPSFKWWFQSLRRGGARISNKVDVPEDPGEFTMIELAEAVRDLTGSRSELVHRTLPADDPRQRQPDIRLAREWLGWEPKIVLREGLKPTIAYFERLLNEGFGKGRAVA
jgi:hypothetical protein